MYMLTLGARMPKGVLLLVFIDAEPVALIRLLVRGVEGDSDSIVSLLTLGYKVRLIGRVYG